MAKEIKLTQESLDAYKDELEYLKTTRADEVAEQLKDAITAIPVTIMSTVMH